MWGMAKMLFYQGPCGHPNGLVPIWEEQPESIKVAWFWIAYERVDYINYKEFACSEDTLDRQYREYYTWKEEDTMPMLKKGDPVWLKFYADDADAVHMVVVEEFPNETVKCTWFDAQNRICEHIFDKNLLMTVNQGKGDKFYRPFSPPVPEEEEQKEKKFGEI